MAIVSVKRAWRWQVARGSMVEIMEGLEAIAAKAAPQLQRLSYAVTGADGETIRFNGELRRALTFAADPYSVEARYSDIGRSFGGDGDFVISVAVVAGRTDVEWVDLKISGPGNDRTDDRMNHARDLVDAELQSRGWKVSDAEAVKPGSEVSPSPASQAEGKGARLTVSEGAKYLGLPRQFLRTLIANGTLPSASTKRGSRFVSTVSVDDLERYRVNRENRVIPSAAPVQHITDAGVKPAPPTQHITGVGVDAKTTLPGKWTRFWNSKLGEWVADHIFGTLFVGAIAATIATIVATTIIRGAGPDADPNTVPATTSPTALTDTSATPDDRTTTTATTATRFAPPAPRPPQEKDIPQASSVDFFDGAVLIGTEPPGVSGTFLNLTTDSLGCPNTYFSVGQRKFVEGLRDGARDFFTVTLLKIAGTTSTVRVQELPMKDWSESPSPTCPSQL